MGDVFDQVIAQFAGNPLALRPPQAEHAGEQRQVVFELAIFHVFGYQRSGISRQLADS
jgi:hypothetical protein